MGRTQIVALLWAVITFVSTACAQEPVYPPVPPATARGSDVKPPATTQASRPIRSAAGSLEEKYDNGKLKSRYAVNVKGVKWGPYTLYSEDGNRVETGAYKNDEREGIRRTYYPDQKIKLQENYAKGKLDGSVIENDFKGTPVRSAEYKDGVPVSDRTFVDGLMVYPRSQKMILAELDRIHKMKLEMAPGRTAIPAHEGGNDSDADRQGGLQRLISYRYLCGVPYGNMSLDASFCAYCEAASALYAAGQQKDPPANPGWPKDHYEFAMVGRHNSISVGSSLPMSCGAMVDVLMTDNPRNNVILFHRRWCLNPSMAKVGFANYKGVSTMWGTDMSRADIPDFDFIAYPGPGLFPASYIGPDVPWTVTLNEKRYQVPTLAALAISVTPARVQLAENKIALTGNPFDLDSKAVDTRAIGIPNCIVFRPVGLTVGPGIACLVEIKGLRAAKGTPAAIRYLVEFFNAEPAVESPAH